MRMLGETLSWLSGNCKLSHSESTQTSGRWIILVLVWRASFYWVSKSSIVSFFNTSSNRMKLGQILK